jgi:hypothetical protein
LLNKNNFYEIWSILNGGGSSGNCYEEVYLAVILLVGGPVFTFLLFK